MSVTSQQGYQEMAGAASLMAMTPAESARLYADRNRSSSQVACEVVLLYSLGEQRYRVGGGEEQEGGGWRGKDGWRDRDRKRGGSGRRGSRGGSGEGWTTQKEDRHHHSLRANAATTKVCSTFLLRFNLMVFIIAFKTVQPRPGQLDIIEEEEEVRVVTKKDVEGEREEEMLSEVEERKEKEENDEEEDLSPPVPGRGRGQQRQWFYQEIPCERKRRRVHPEPSATSRSVDTSQKIIGAASVIENYWEWLHASQIVFKW